MSGAGARHPPARKPRRLLAALLASLTFVLLTCAAYLGVAASSISSLSPIGLWMMVWGVLLALALYGLPIGGALAVYHAVRGPILATRGETYCGGCGYRLRGLTEPRCSECGRSI